MKAMQFVVYFIVIEMVVPLFHNQKRVDESGIANKVA